MRAVYFEIESRVTRVVKQERNRMQETQIDVGEDEFLSGQISRVLDEAHAIAVNDELRQKRP